MLENEKRSQIFFYVLMKLPFIGTLFCGVALGDAEISMQATCMTVVILAWVVSIGEIMTNNERRQWGLATDRKWSGLFALLLMMLAIVLTVSAFSFVTDISSEAAWGNVVRGFAVTALAASLLKWWPTKARQGSATEFDENASEVGEAL